MDEVEKKYAGKLRVLRVDVQSNAGKSLTQQMGFQFTPTFIFFDAQGNEIWREVGTLTVENISTGVQP